MLWRDTLVDAAIFREWMANVGRRNAKERISHLLCEMALRWKAVDLARDHSYPLPVTQTELADATGLSAVHVNRVLQELKAEGLVSVRSLTVSVADWEGLKETAGFDPIYLHFDPDEGLG